MPLSKDLIPTKSLILLQRVLTLATRVSQALSEGQFSDSSSASETIVAYAGFHTTLLLML
jgi:hypothetical protein